MSEQQERPLPDPIAAIARHFCGCGSPEMAWGWVLDYLEAKAAEPPEFEYPETGEEAIAVYLMDHLELTEHGTSVAGAWLTKAGQEALVFLREHGVEWYEKEQWIDSQGVSWGTP